MSSQVPIVLVGSAAQSPLEARLAAFGAFPIVHSRWKDATAAIADVQPGAVIADLEGGPQPELTALAAGCEATAHYTPLIVLGRIDEPPHNALPFATELGLERLDARLTAALRVRTAHMTVLRRLTDSAVRLPDGDPLQDAAALLVGRGRAYAPLSVALGERMAVVGALSVEAAAKHLNGRDIDAVILGDGFSHRVALAFLTVLSEDVRFRNLPVIVSGSFAGGTLPDLPNLQIMRGAPEQVVAHAVPLTRQHAFEMRLMRTLKALDAGGLVDPSTGLLTSDAFVTDWSKAVTEAIETGTALSAARFSFEGADARARRDAARILARLLRGTDFAALHEDSIVTAFAETDLRSAHVIARRLASVLRQTALGAETRIDPSVTLATVKPDDTPESAFARLHGQRVAS